jgi:nicotinate-nucleotide pyrophosphorylase (carboxylating)
MLNHETTDDALKLIALALTEDIGSPTLVAGVDCTTDAIVPIGVTAAAAIISRETGIVCGVEVCRLAVKHFAEHLKLDVTIDDGGAVEPGATIAEFSGPARDILTLERTCLNFLGRLSGIATLAHQYANAIAGTEAQVFDTRKTTPGWRRLEKWAVASGGGQNHRMGLYDAMMIKDNHLAFLGSRFRQPTDSIPHAIETARRWIAAHQTTLPNGSKTIIQLEVDTLDQLKIGLQTDCNIILLDNMSPEKLTEAVAIRNQTAPQIQLEASGGVNLETVREIAETGVERISVGALTHSAINFDIGLDWRLS